MVYCLRILEAIGKIRLYARDYSDPFEFFDANDQKDFNACLLQLLHIGEQVNRLSEHTKVNYPHIAWRDIKAFRNIVAHDYVGIDKLIVFETIQIQLPSLKQEMEHIIQAELANHSFDQSEYILSKQSNYYRHINFTTIS